MKPKILLTFDLEEFDLPLEYRCPISDKDQIDVTNNGLLKLIMLLSKYDIPATFFTTAYYARKNTALLKSLSTRHEISSHSNRHSDFKVTDPLVSKEEIEKITGRIVRGFRMPRFKKTDLDLIKAAGYKYDSSVHPTCIPGRYNNFFAHRSIHFEPGSKLIEFPVSVSPLIRFPLFWLSFKNIPFPTYLFLCKEAIRKDSYLHLCFHPWEFADLMSYKIPEFIKNPSGEVFAGKFEKLIIHLKLEGEFSTVSEYLDSSGYI